MLQLASPFSTGAVLQRNTPITIWGKSQPNSIIEVEINGNITQGECDTQGFFEFQLSAMEAGGPYILNVTDINTKEQRVVEDVLIGEVWFGSGQSNMQWLLKNTRPDQIDEICNALENCNTIRILKMPSENWENPTPQNIKEFSALGIWHAYFLHKELNCPVGIMCNAIGGTLIEQWSPNPELEDRQKKLYLMPTGNQDVPEVNAKFISENIDKWQDIDMYELWTEKYDNSHGAVWYATKIDIPESWQNQDLTLIMPGIDKQDITFFNGTEIGRTGGNWSQEYWNSPREYTIPAKELKVGLNELKIRVVSWISDGGFRKNQEITPQLVFGNKSINLESLHWKFTQEIAYRSVKNMGAGELYHYWLTPFAPYTIRGVLWYQGSSNSTLSIEKSIAYREQLTQMITAWRTLWKCNNLPFYVFQLCGWDSGDYKPENPVPFLRDAQRLSVQDGENCYLIPLLEFSEADIHTRNKRDIAKRGIQTVIDIEYNKKDNDSQLVFEKATSVDNSLVLEFSNSEGLHWRELGPNPSFYIAGDDKIFVPAIAEIIDNRVVLTSDKITTPVAARYAWVTRPECKLLFNKKELSVAQFRTDSWKN